MIIKNTFGGNKLYLLITNTKHIHSDFLYKSDLIFLDQDFNLIKKIEYKKSLKTILKETKLDLKDLIFINNKEALELIDVKNEFDKINVSEVTHIFNSNRDDFYKLDFLFDKEKGLNAQLMDLNTIKELMLMNKYINKEDKIDDLELLKQFKYKF